MINMLQKIICIFSLKYKYNRIKYLFQENSLAVMHNLNIEYQAHVYIKLTIMCANYHSSEKDTYNFLKHIYHFKIQVISSGLLAGSWVSVVV